MSEHDHRDDAPAADGDRDRLLQLASVVAHQLKSPLSSVQTVLASVLGGFAGPLDARQRWLLEKALERCGKGIDLVGDLLRLRSLDRLEEEALGPVDLTATLASAVDALRDAARDRDLRLELELPEAQPAWIHGEGALVREIVGVLLDNAVKYTPSGGRVTACLRIEPGEEPTVTVEVRDTGIGVPAEDRERLFEEFFRASNAKRQAAEGTGLGLTFARRAARRLGGDVRLETAPEGGARALASFPRRPDYDGAAEQAIAAIGDSRAEVSRRVVIVGGVTAGAKAAARIVRLDPAADVTIVERGRFLAYSGCGLPFYVSGAVAEQRALLETPLGVLRDSAFFHDLKNVRAMDRTEALAIDRKQNRVRVRSLVDRRERYLPYDTLILATGAAPIVPDLPGVDLDGIHTLHGVEDAEAIRSRLGRPRAKDVVIVGGGLLGCQITEAASARGARITLVERRPSILPGLDEELAALVLGHLESHGVRVLCGKAVDRFEGEERVTGVRLADGTTLPCDLVLLGLGRRPEIDLARDAGLEIGSTGAILVDPQLRTTDPTILAAGDCAEQVHAVTGRPAWIPGAVPAAIQGRVAADNVCGLEERSPAITGTTIVKLFDWTAAHVGLNERAAREEGFRPLSVLIPGPDRAHFIPTARSLVLKLVADEETGRVLGAQAVGPGEIAKRIDVVATALAAGFDLDRLAHLTLGYAPPFSMAMDSVITAANVLRNKREGRFRGISPPELWQRMLAGDGTFLLDVRQPVEYGRLKLRGSLHVPLGSLRGRIDGLPRDRPIVVVCSLGLRSYEASRILSARGFEDVRVLDGGLEAWPYSVEKLV